MKKESFWKILAFVLLIVNLGILGFLFLERNPEGPRPGKPDFIIIDGLHLDKEQILRFEQLKNGHRESMDSLEEIEKKVRKSIFAEIQKGISNDSVQNENLKQLTAIRESRDQITLAHFRDLYHLCKPEQRAYYAQTIELFAKRLMQGGPKPRGPRP